jgi:lipopolysaccharide biosynthesis glycosyltransferase
MSTAPAPSGEREPLELACAARRDYVPHCAAMLHSVLSVAERPVRVHFLHGPDLRRSHFSRLERMVGSGGGEIRFLSVSPDRVAGLRTLDFLPASHWYRIFLPELLPEVGRVLYVDADAIAVDSLEGLWRTELGGNLLAAVTNVFQRDHAGHAQRIGLRDPGAYFNTGVMVLDLEGWRRERCTQALLEYARSAEARLGLPEQDAINIVLGDRRLPLHPRWNLMNSILLFPWAADVLGGEAVREAVENPAIRHFEGPSVNKPWHLLCEREDRELYRRHRRGTPWPRVRPAGITPGNVWRRLARVLRT